MKRLLVSLALIGGVGAAAVLATGAFFSDTETSTGNQLVAGDIDLLIGNESYLNGAFQDGNTSWTPTNLSASELFFDFTDLKPGDWEEDTISLNPGTNEAWICSNITLTESAENVVNEPESSAGDNENNGIWDGELDSNLHFVFWADDGDNVLEDNEYGVEGANLLLTGTPADLPQIDGNNGVTFALADSTNNVWTKVANDPVNGASTVYIGKAFCFGEFTFAPITQDNSGSVLTPTNGAGFTCSGVLVDNMSQTDSVKGNVSFYAVQARNNAEFVCSDAVFSN